MRRTNSEGRARLKWERIACKLAGGGQAIALGAALMALSGCVNLEPQADRTQFYVLSEPGAPAPSEGPTEIAVRRVELPEYLDSSRVVARESAHELRYLSRHRWSGSLDAMIGSALAESMARAQPSLAVSASPIEAAPKGLWIRVLRFEGLPNGEVEVSFDWRLESNAEGESTRSGRIVRRGAWDSANAGSLVEALSTLLQEGARELAAELE